MHALLNSLESALAVSPALSLGLSFLAGILTGYNPCCFPMVPAIIGFVGGYGTISARMSFILSLFFAMGLALATALLGALAGLLGGIFGNLHPGLRYAFAAVPILMD